YVANADLMVNTYFGTLDDTHKTIVKGLFENIENQQKQIIQLKDDNETLDKENDLLSGENLKWADRNLINALVRAYGSKLGNFGEAWTKFKKEILYKHSININARITNFMNSTGKKTKPRTLKMLHDEELSNAVSTIVALCRDNDVDISDIIKKYENELNRKELAG
ncbi:transporter, partial [Clostridium botulinum D/C]|nr:transporter [Clostridium botulinum D/C]